MKKSDVLAVIDDMILDLSRGRDFSKTLYTYNSGGIYYLRELKFKIEKMGTKKEKN